MDKATKLVKVETLKVDDLTTDGEVVSVERGQCTIDPERADCVMLGIDTGTGFTWEAHRRPDAWVTLLV